MSITQLQIDNTLAVSKAASNQLDKLLLELFTEINGNYSSLSKLTYLVNKVSFMDLPIKMKGIHDAARDLLGVEYNSASKAFKVVRGLDYGYYLTTSILKYKPEPKEKDDPLVVMMKSMRSLAKKGLKERLDRQELLNLFARAIDKEIEYLEP